MSGQPTLESALFRITFSVMAAAVLALFGVVFAGYATSVKLIHLVRN